MMDICPVCGYTGLTAPPYDEFGCSSHEICPSCGTQFGYHDATIPHSELRRRWVAAGAPWHSKAHPAPPGWDAAEQLRRAGFAEAAADREADSVRAAG